MSEVQSGEFSQKELDSDELIELEFHVVGVTFEGRQELLAELHEQDHRMIDVDLVVDDANAFDPDAVKVVASYSTRGNPARFYHIGYAPKEGAKICRMCLESGRPHAVEIIWLGRGILPPRTLGTYGMRIRAKFFAKLFPAAGGWR